MEIIESITFLSYFLLKSWLFILCLFKIVTKIIMYILVCYSIFNQLSINTIIFKEALNY